MDSKTTQLRNIVLEQSIGLDLIKIKCWQTNLKALIMLILSIQ